MLPVPSIVACTGSSATLKAEFRNSVGSLPADVNSLSTVGYSIV